MTSGTQTRAEERDPSARASVSPAEGGGGNGAGKSVFKSRRRWLARLNAWRKHTPLNPYWTDTYWLRRSTLTLVPFAQGRLIDVGCGEQPFGKQFREQVEQYVGLEYPPVADNLIPEIWGQLERIRGIVDVFGDGMRMPFRDGACDTLLALEVLEHVREPERLVLELARVLRPGGRLLLTVPFAAPLHQLPFDFHRYTPGGVRTLLERHGFEIEHLTPRGNFAAVVGSLTSQYLLRAIAAKEQLHDGSVTISRWRAPLALPLIAVVQVFFHALARLTNDTSYCLGYTVVARRGDSADS